MPKPRSATAEAQGRRTSARSRATRADPAGRRSSPRSTSRTSSTRSSRTASRSITSQRTRGPGDPGRAGVRRRRRGRRARTGAALHRMTMSLLDEGTASHDARSRSPRPRSGLAPTSAPAMRPTARSSTLSALSPNLAPSLDLLADVVAQPGLRAGRGRPGPRPDADRHRADAEGPDAGRAARAAGACCTAPPSLWRTGRRRSQGDRGVHPRRSRRLPAALAAARQRQDLRRLRPAAERGQAAARRSASATGPRPRPRQGRQELHRAAAAAGGAEDPAGQPPRGAAVDHPRRRS